MKKRHCASCMLTSGKFKQAQNIIKNKLNWFRATIFTHVQNANGKSRISLN